MLEKTFGLLFFLKQPKNQKKEERYLYLRITVNGIAKEVSLKRIWSANKWNQATGRATGNKEDARSLNEYLDTLASRTHQTKTEFLNKHRTLTAEKLVNLLTGKGEEERMLLTIFKVNNLQIKALIGKEYALRTLFRYNTTFDHTKAFIKWKFNTEDINIEELNYEFAADFSYWLRTVKNCGHNTTMKYISTLKKIILECVRKEWIPKDPFAGFKTATKEVKINALDTEELNRLKHKTFEIDRLRIVRDIFLFSCYTGLAYVDVNKLKRSEITIGVDGKKWLFIERQKTGSPSRVPLLSVALDIFETYKDHPKCLKDDSAFPVLTNQKMNAYLKEIADCCIIKKRLTFHIARHTFATTVTLTNGVPIETVSKMMGHKTIKQTQHYAKIVDLKISEDMLTLTRRLAEIE